MAVKTYKPPVGARQNFNHPLSRGLACHLITNEGGGVTLNDVSLKRNTGTMVANPSWSGGRTGKTLTYNGSTQYTTLPDAAFTAHTVGSISAWVKSGDVSDAAGKTIFVNTNTADSNPLIQIAFISNTLRIFMRNAALAIQINASITATSYLNQWIHIVYTMSTTGGKMYVNGIEQTLTYSTGSSSTVFWFSNLSINQYTIGMLRRVANSAFFNGAIEAFRVYNRPLSDQEVKRLYAQPFGDVIFPGKKFLASPGITFDAATNSGYQAASSSYSWSHTCTGSNRYLTVGISMLSLAQTVSGITYNSVAMTFLGAQNSVSGAARVELWGLIAPATGSNTIAVTLTGAIASAGNASSYAGVNQTSPTEAFNSAQATNVGAADATVDITTVANNDWVVDIVATDDTAVTVGAGQTQTGNVTGAGGSGAMSYEGPKATGGAVTMSWTNVGALATWTIGGVALRPVAASGGSLVKTVIGLAQASVKTVNDLAISLVKTINGLANV